MLVNWLDSAVFRGWRSDGESFLSEPCESLGYVVADTEGELTLAGSRSASQWCQIITIPKVAIVRVKRVKL